MKEQYSIEYHMGNASRKSLWPRLSSPAGLSLWFADDVNIAGRKYTFRWKREEQTAEVAYVKTESKIRYRWLNDEPEYYFEFKISTDELTRSITLEITDFAEPDEKDEAIKLWDTQVELLKRNMGI